MRSYVFLLTMFCITISHSYGVIINSYASVTNISGMHIKCNRVEIHGQGFQEGGIVMLYQVQDDVIGGNTGNNSNFGKLADIKSAGLIDIVKIQNVQLSGSSLNFDIVEPLEHQFNTGSNSRLQVISVPVYEDYSTSQDIKARQWNGYIGGVVAMKVKGTLNLRHNIDVNGAGFRGGVKSNNYDVNAQDNAHIYRTNHNGFAEKGEGIYPKNNQYYRRAKAKIINGGGGGSPMQNGGGGGGNYTSGGRGGKGWYSYDSHRSQGGISLKSSIDNTPNRMFLGGGGGGGQQRYKTEDDNYASNGANGGGLIFLMTKELKVYNERYIVANGKSSGKTGGANGAGGGGAGGSISMIIDTITFNKSTDKLKIKTNGGNGGNVDYLYKYGPGAGGGQGIIKFFNFDPDSYSQVIIRSKPGKAGKADNKPSTQPEQSGSGGSIGGGTHHVEYPTYDDPQLLPVEFLGAEIRCSDTDTEILWSTLSEKNNMLFTIEESNDLKHWEKEGETLGSGNSTTKRDYIYYDNTPKAYYRLSQTDFDGTVTYLMNLSNNCKESTTECAINSANYFENTITAFFNTTIEKNIIEKIAVYEGSTGRKLSVNNYKTLGQKILVDMPNLAAGMYILEVSLCGEQLVKKFIVKM